MNRVEESAGLHQKKELKIYNEKGKLFKLSELVELAKKSNIKEVILDKGNRTLKENSFIYYVLKGLSDFGVDVHSDNIKIDEKRLYGEHISGYYPDRKGNQFSAAGEKIKNIREDFNKTLENIKNGK